MPSEDKKINHLFKNWLSISLFLVLLMIVVGGMTRLTNSGLSITEWELFTGIFPPMNASTWNKYFELYKAIPQFKISNPLMNLQEFKVIFYWEYAHRLLGRFIGLFFLIPLLYFHYKKIKIEYLMPAYLVLFLIIFQGFIGWYMVESGLVNNVTVSHYRLSLHLGMAVIIISILFWQLICLRKNNQKSFFIFSKKRIPFIFFLFLIFTQIIFGAFVSGLDAGKIYQNWPLMGMKYFPDDIIISSFINLFNFDAHSLVQFYHRNLAYFIILYVIFLGFVIKNSEETILYKPYIVTVVVISLQIALGIFTLLSDLHIMLASAHQIVSIILILSALNLYYSMIK